MKFSRPNSSDEILIEEAKELKIEGDNYIIPIWIYQALLADAAYMEGMIEGMLSVLKPEDEK